MCNSKFEDDEYYAGRDPMEILSDPDFLDWVEGKDLVAGAEIKE